jgi:hypothetical protein
VDLGSFIELEGFTEREPGELVIIKKLIGNHVKRLSERLPELQKVALTQKHSHGHFEIHGKLLWDGREAFTNVTDTNLFFALDSCLKKLEQQAMHVH